MWAKHVATKGESYHTVRKENVKNQRLTMNTFVPFLRNRVITEVQSLMGMPYYYGGLGWRLVWPSSSYKMPAINQ